MTRHGLRPRHVTDTLAVTACSDAGGTSAAESIDAHLRRAEQPRIAVMSFRTPTGFIGLLDGSLPISPDQGFGGFLQSFGQYMHARLFFPLMQVSWRFLSEVWPRKLQSGNNDLFATAEATTRPTPPNSSGGSIHRDLHLPPPVTDRLPVHRDFSLHSCRRGPTIGP